LGRLDSLVERENRLVLADVKLKDETIFRAVRMDGMVWVSGLLPGAVMQILRSTPQGLEFAKLAPHDSEVWDHTSLPSKMQSRGSDYPAE
jgi:hypothetical protein